jgi:hypothetical protein
VQRVYNQDPSDPYGLDALPGESFTGEQGVACENLLPRPMSPCVEEAGKENVKRTKPALKLFITPHFVDGLRNTSPPQVGWIIILQGQRLSSW